MKTNHMSKVGEYWTQALKESGYEHTCKTKHQFNKLMKLTRVWKRILSEIDLRLRKSCFEVGCGGGIHLVRLALNGFLVEGIDCSHEVVKRAESFIREVAIFNDKVNRIRIYNGDFLSEDYKEIGKKYDLVFDFGVVEHFLEKEDRLEFINRKIQLAKENGWVVSVVPSGMHPCRDRQRKKGHGGYNIPEIDYTPELLVEEMSACGANNVIILPHNIMGYLNISPKVKSPQKIIYYLFQLLPQYFLTNQFLYKNAYTYIAIVKK